MLLNGLVPKSFFFHAVHDPQCVRGTDIDNDDVI